MRTAIAERRFRLAFQPVVTLTNRKVHHFEALLRPIHIASSPVHTTQDFVTFSEAVGLSEELDLAVLEQALVALRDSRAVSVAVNVSGLSMQSPAFRDRVFQLIDAYPDIQASGSHAGPGTAPPPGRLMIELTETAEIEDAAGAAATLERLRAANIPVCIDDFGAGAAAFRYLRDFQVDYIKIDGGYVRAAAHSARERGFVASMRDLAQSVGAKVIAEMIETEAEAALMLELGVEYGQGWLFGRAGSLPGAASRR